MQSTRRQVAEHQPVPSEEQRAPAADGAVRFMGFKPRTVWWAVMAAGLLIIWFVLSQAIDAAILIFVAIVFAEGIRPVVDWLDRWLPRPLAVFLLYALIVVVLFGVTFLLLRPFVAQVTAFINDLPRYAAKARQLLDHVQHVVSQNPQAARLLQSLPSQITGNVQSLLVVLLNAPLMLADILFKVIEMFLLSFFWLTATRGLKPFVLDLFPASLRDEASDVIAEMSHNLGGYLRGVVVNLVVIAILSGLGLALLGVPYSVLLGVLAGLNETLPIIGPWISGAAAALVALISVGPLKAGEVVLLFMVVQQVEGNTLVPYIMYRTTSLSPLTVLIAIIVGGAVFGLVGAVIGVPIGVVVEIAVRRVLAPMARRAALRAWS